VRLDNKNEYEMGYLLSRSRYVERRDEYKKINCRQGYVQRGSACHPISRTGSLSTASKGDGTGTLAKLTVLAAGAALASKDPQAAAKFLALGVGAMIANKVIREKLDDVETYKEFAKEREDVAKNGIPARDAPAYSHLPKELAISVYAAERKIQHNDFETLFAFDVDGKPSLIRKGQIGSVSLGITDAYNQKAAKNTVLMTHNHPDIAGVGDTSAFSPADLKVGAFFSNIKEIRATGAETTSVLQAKREGAFSPSSSLAKELADVHANLNRQLTEKWQDKQPRTVTDRFQDYQGFARKISTETDSFLRSKTGRTSGYIYKKTRSIQNRIDSTCDRGKPCKGEDGQTYCIPKNATCGSEKRKPFISSRTLATIGVAAASATTLALIANAPKGKQHDLRQKARDGMQVGEAILSTVKGRGGLGDRLTRSIGKLRNSSAGRSLQAMIQTPQAKKNFVQQVGDFVTLKSIGRQEKDKLKMLGYEIGSSLVGAFGGKVARDATERTLSDSSLGQTEKTALLMFSDAATQYVGTKASFAALQKASPSYAEGSHPIVKIAIGIAARLAVEKAVKNKYED